MQDALLKTKHFEGVPSIYRTFNYFYRSWWHWLRRLKRWLTNFNHDLAGDVLSCLITNIKKKNNFLPSHLEPFCFYYYVLQSNYVNKALWQANTLNKYSQIIRNNQFTISFNPTSIRTDIRTTSKANSRMKQYRRGNAQALYMYNVGVCLPSKQKECWFSVWESTFQKKKQFIFMWSLLLERKVSLVTVEEK